MLRYAKLRTADFAKVIPELATIDPYILSRLDIEGASRHIYFSTCDLTLVYQVATARICAAKKLTCGLLWVTKH
jgi:hypothetical protein